MLLCIHVNRLPFINTYGFANRMHTTLSTVNAIMAGRTLNDILDDDMIRATRDMSISVMISFLCESGVLEGDQMELTALKERMLTRPRHEKVPPGFSCMLSIIAMLRHVTCMVISGEMYVEMPTLSNICVAAMHHVPSSFLYKVNWRSWSSLEQSIHIGEVVRLTLLLEANLRVSMSVAEECIQAILCDVVEGVGIFLTKMRYTDKKTLIEKSPVGPKQH